MIKQTNKELLPKIQLTGCYFMDVNEIWSSEANIELLPEDINEVYLKAVKSKKITENCFMEYGAAEEISKILNEMFNENIMISYVGRFNKGVISWDNGRQIFNALVGRFQKPGDKGSHFKRVSKSANVIYDSWPSLDYKPETLQDSRLFKVVKRG